MELIFGPVNSVWTSRCSPFICPKTIINFDVIPQESGCLLYSGDQIPRWQLPHNQGQGHQVQALLVQKRQRHCWCRSVCGRKVDRESFWGAENLRQSHLNEVYMVTFQSVYDPQSGLSDEVKDLFFDQLCAVTARIRISDPMRRLEWPCWPCRHWIQGSAWWDGVWQAGTRCWGWENPRVCPSIQTASWEHMFQETWQLSHHVQVGKRSHTDRLCPFL